MDLSLKKRRWIVRKKIQGWRVKEICSHARISRFTFYYHWNAYQRHSWKGLEPKSRRPHTIHRTPEAIVNEVLQIRKKHEWGPNKIEGYLKNRGLRIGHNTIHRILCNGGLNSPIDKPRRIWGKKRFERAHSNSLWQADFKLTPQDEWMITFLDDHSRFIVGCATNETEKAEDAMKLFDISIRRFGTPVQVLTDRGSQFFDAEGITQFRQFCIARGIEHIVASKRRPSTIGKVERWHRTYVEEHHKYPTLWRLVRYYNYVRPHQSLGYKVPAEVYFRDRV
jgi:transposase InsO family protein